MSYYVQQPSVAASVGAGLGKGLAEQLPKEIERERLASGLRNLKPGMSPLENISNLLGIPGMTPEMAQHILPLIRQEALRTKGKPSTGDSTVPSTPFFPGEYPAVDRTISNEEAANKKDVLSSGIGIPEYYEKHAVDDRTITTAEAAKEALKQIYVPSPQELDDRAFQLMASDPVKYQTFEEARNFAKEEAETFRNQQQEKINLRDRQLQTVKILEDSIAARVRQETQKELSVDGLFKTVPGEYYNNIVDRAKVDFLKGKSIEDSVKDATKKILSLEKATTKMKRDLGTRPIFGKAPKQLLSDIGSLRKSYEEAGALELFKDDQKRYLDIGDHLASFNAYPLSEKIRKTLSGIKEKDTPEVVAAKIYDGLDPSDSIFSLGLVLNQLGFNDRDVVNELMDLEKTGIYSIDNDRQRREIAAYTPASVSLGDLLFNSFSDIMKAPLMIFGEKKKVGFFERLKRFSGKK